ncbi:MAG: transporter substrate-binding domain-containing protein [Firmicutes bacterium]|nr:transporter substrate-binding domain-containing protein [Bacillota bacterium]
MLQQHKGTARGLSSIIFVIMMLTAVGGAETAEGWTTEERAYIANSPVIKAATSSGAAPLAFADGKGEVQGIFRGVMDRIAQISGLTFEYQAYDSLEAIFNSDADIIFGISPNYAPSGMQLSQPFLESEAIIYMNQGVASQQLEGRIFAAIEGGVLPEGINAENAIFFATREDSLDAVEAGIADYGYGNAYSVVYYSSLKDYQNLITVPRGKEPRKYSVGLLHGDEVLLSIINKSISSITTSQMQTLILDVA